MRCGIEAWPPLPRHGDLEDVGRREQRSAARREHARPELGRDVQREGGVRLRLALEQALLEHDARAGVALLAGLEHEHHAAAQLRRGAPRAAAPRPPASRCACRARRRASARRSSTRRGGPVSSGIGSASMSARSRIERARASRRAASPPPRCSFRCVSISSGSASSRSSSFSRVFGSSSPSSGSAWIARRSATSSGSSSLASSSSASRSAMAPPRREHGRAAGALEASRAMQPLAARIDALAESKPDGAAFFSDSEDLSWREYARRSDRFAAHLAGLGLAPGERVAVLLPDGPGVHVAFVGCEKAGLVVMGIGPRAGRDEIRHLVTKAGASALVTRPASRDHDFRALFETLRGEGAAAAPPRRGRAPARPATRPATRTARRAPADLAQRRLGVERSLPAQLHLRHHRPAQVRDAPPGALAPLPRAGRGLRRADAGRRVLLGAARAVRLRALDRALHARRARRALRRARALHARRRRCARIERHRVTVLAAVSTQFIMMLERARRSRSTTSPRCACCSPAARRFRTSARREFEERTGAAVLQFYGSNETGALSCTTLARHARACGCAPPATSSRACTCGSTTTPAPTSPRAARGQPACKGPVDEPRLLRGRRRQREAVHERRLDAHRRHRHDRRARAVLRVVGRVADFIIRGGKNISAAGGRGRGRDAPGGRARRRRRAARSGVRRARLRLRRAAARREPRPRRAARAPARARRVDASGGPSA